MIAHVIIISYIKGNCPFNMFIISCSRWPGPPWGGGAGGAHPASGEERRGRSMAAGGQIHAGTGPARQGDPCHGLVAQAVFFSSCPSPSAGCHPQGLHHLQVFFFHSILCSVLLCCSVYSGCKYLIVYGWMDCRVYNAPPWFVDSVWSSSNNSSFLPCRWRAWPAQGAPRRQRYLLPSCTCLWVLCDDETTDWMSWLDTMHSIEPWGKHE